MRIALAHDFLVQYGGAERVLEVFCEMFPGAPIFTLFYDENGSRGRFHGKDIRTSFLSRIPLLGTRMGFFRHLFFWIFPAAVEQFDFSGFDLVLSASANYSKGVVTPKNVPHICYCYTPTRYLWEDVRKHVTGWLRSMPAMFFGELLFRAMRRWDRKAANRPAKMMAVSSYIARRIEMVYGRRPNGVLFPPVDRTKFCARPAARGSTESGGAGYFLMVGRLLPYKRSDLGIRACNALRLPLKVAGAGRERKRLEGMAGPTVEFLGWVPDGELPNLYRGARALIFPQTEDFGLVAAEAIASGTPVIAYRDGGALDIVQEDVNGVFFDRQEPEALIEAIEKFNQRKFDPETVSATANRFDKDLFKQRVLDLIGSH